MTSTRYLGFAAALLLFGCMGESGLEGDPTKQKADVSPTQTTPGTDPFAPCTVLAQCCPKEDIVCVADPDKGDPICKCSSLWDCSKNPKKCEQDKQVPSGGGTWDCTWTEQVYTCAGTSSTPPGGSGWTCTKKTGDQYVCTKSPPNPSNKPAGTSVWKCTVQGGKIQCDRITPPDASVPPPAKPDAGVVPKPDTQPPPPKKETNCADAIDNDGDGLVDCKDPDCPPCAPPPCPAGKECCDGIDNDGDGQIDEGNVCGNLGNGQPCPPGAIQSCDCYCGVHRRCKADGTWGPCKVDGSCKVANVISQSACGWGQYCDFGNCVFGFTGGQCKHHNDCPNPLICDLGQCVPDNYFACP